MKTIGEVQIQKREDGIIDITIPNISSDEDTTYGITKTEAIGIAYYLLGLTDNMEEQE